MLRLCYRRPSKSRSSSAFPKSGCCSSSQTRRPSKFPVGTALAVNATRTENKMVQVKIGDKFVGDGYPSYIVGEIGINHNGDLGIARRLIDVASVAEADAVKFQKRTVDVVYTAEELAKPRENPFGATNGDLKRGLEFGRDAYRNIDRYCKEKNVTWFA